MTIGQTIYWLGREATIIIDISPDCVKCRVTTLYQSYPQWYSREQFTLQPRPAPEK